MYGPCFDCDGLWAVVLLVGLVLALSPVMPYNRGKQDRSE
jgi:hypothetical protein